MSRDHILVLNAGSSSVKFARFCIGDEGSLPVLAIGGLMDGIGGHARFGGRDRTGSVAPNPNDGDEVEAISDHSGALPVLFARMDRHGGGGRSRAGTPLSH